MTRGIDLTYVYIIVGYAVHVDCHLIIKFKSEDNPILVTLKPYLSDDLTIE